MLGTFGTDHARISAAAESGDARSAALLLMSEALARLDSDDKIPAVIGAHLQSAIDALWTSAAGGQHSVHLH
jgi:hypothetical protein